MIKNRVIFKREMKGKLINLETNRYGGRNENPKYLNKSKI
jgi:hypothetical protein